MPVWHEALKPWIEAERLQVVGITQEQHRDRCRLYAQWRGFDWPILWDPLNLTGAQAVPNFLGLDEHGVVRWNSPRPDGFEERFLDVAFEAPAAPDARNAPAVSRALLEDPARGGFAGPVLAAYARILWGGEEALDAAIATLAEDLDDPVQDPRAIFRLGVAYRLRFDTPRRRTGDFRRALEAWSRALERDPNQYIWRRRIQQYGPRLDKPYPFYGWVDEARRELRARGETPVELVAALTGSERSAGARGQPPAESEPAVEPDPEGGVRRDDGDWLLVETAVARDTGGRAGVVRVHVDLKPRAEGSMVWNNEAEPLQLWIDAPAGWDVSPQLLTFPNPAAATSREPRALDFEVHAPEELRSGTLAAYVLVHACEKESGRCVFLRRDLALPVEFAAAR